MDPTSALGIQDSVGECVLFTELGAGSSKGIMHTVSLIDNRWISSYLGKTKQIDNFRLAGIAFDSERKTKGKEEESEKVKKERMLEERERRIKEAK